MNLEAALRGILPVPTNWTAGPRGLGAGGGQPSSVWGSLQEGVGLHRAAATSSSFGLGKRGGGAFSSHTAGPASAWGAGAEPQESGGVGPALCPLTFRPHFEGFHYAGELCPREGDCAAGCGGDGTSER